jgi:hypothetical protein
MGTSVFGVNARIRRAVEIFGSVHFVSFCSIPHRVAGSIILLPLWGLSPSIIIMVKVRSPKTSRCPALPDGF